MRRTMKITLVFVIVVLMCSQVAFAASCEFTFTANGKTYYGAHYAIEGYYDCFNREIDLSPHFNEYLPEYAAYEAAFDAAKYQHHAVCPYIIGGDLGDQSVPMVLLYGGAVLAAISAIIVHQKRMRI